jgi:hypothetical protein
MKFTIEELAEILCLDKDAADHLVKALLALKPPAAKCRGERESVSGVGHGEKVYQLMPTAAARLSRLIRRVPV